MHVELDELRGVKVFDANGRAIGRVKAALVDMETWLVDTLRIGVTRRAAADLDMHWSYFRLAEDRRHDRADSRRGRRDHPARLAGRAPRDAVADGRRARGDPLARPVRDGDPSP